MNHETDSGEVIVMGDARERAIPDAFLLAATTLEATASELSIWKRETAGARGFARRRSTQLLSGAIDDFVGEYGEPVHPVVARLAEALVAAQVAQIPGLIDTADYVGSVLDDDARDLMRIAEANG